MSRSEEEHTEIILRDLMEACRESEAGLLRAASRLQKTGLKEFLGAEALQHSLFTAELELQLKKLGVLVKPLTPRQTKLRGWKEIRGTRLLPSGDETVLRLCERGERATLGEYLTALRSDLPIGVLELVERQHLQLKEAYTRLDQIRQQLRSDERRARLQPQDWSEPAGRSSDNTEHRSS